MLSEKRYENILIKKDKFTEDTLIALGLVKKYIIKNNLIIVGGMAIDNALRIKGTQLYEDDVLPDYDFYSPHHHFDAYKIAEMLHKTGMNNITVINANHTSTMRVRVNYTVVADITYMPPILYDNLPVLHYKDLRVIHPHFQMIDQHRALSLPYENPPWEVILHRWKKDAARYDLLYTYYPIDKPELLDIPVSNKFKLSDDITLSSIMLKDQCVGGFAGLLYWINIAEKNGYKKKIKTNIGEMQIESVGLIASIPIDSHGISIYSTDINKMVKSIKSSHTIKKTRQYNRFLDKLPYKKILDDKWEIFDSAGYLIGAHKLEMGIYVANLQNIMLYMLANYMIFKIKKIKRGYSFYIGYLIARELVEWAGKNYKKKKVCSLFLPTAEVYGDAEISDSYINSKRIFLENIKEKPREKLQPNIIYPETFRNGKIPQKYYKFNHDSSILYKFDGRETKKYNNRIFL